MIKELAIYPWKEKDFPEGVLRLEYLSCFDQKKDWALLQVQKSDWLVKLHGHGSSGDQIYTRQDLKNNWLPKFLTAGFSLFSPHLRANAWMSPQAVSDLHGLLGYLREKFQARRFFFFSGSMGGTGNLIYSALHPEDVTAVVALCPATDLTLYYHWCREQKGPEVLKEIAAAIENSYGGPPESLPRLYRQHSALANCSRLVMPVCVVHGDADAIIPVELSRLLARCLKNHHQFFYQEIPGGNHDAPLMMEEPFLWLLEKKNA